MSREVRIVAFAGSTRTESYNKKLLRIAVKGAQAAGATVTLLDLRDYPLPLFDEDLEKASGAPENARKLKQQLVEHDGILLSAPEYNSSITAVLKNAIDWVSRPVPGEPALLAFQGKVTALMSASPGALGGLRGLVHVRSILGNIGVLVLPEQVAVPRAFEAFADDGSLKDAKQQEAVEKLGKSLAGVLVKLKA
ncbi:MAG: NAD(P)H-dependent oxidoreductase [Gemmataceae bacterium]|nr:NAD(P)H-dependent oxidoreductase [Gemmataceae bacterium]